MSWNNSDGRAWPGDATGGWKPDEGAWKPEDSRGDTWGSGGDTTGNDNWGVGVGGGANDGVFGGEVGGGDGSGDGGGDRTCRICKQEGHFARECPDKPASGSLTGVCFNCREVGHNKADCPNPVVEHTMACRLCQQEGHRAVECTSRRKIDWTGVPELSVQDAWSAIVDSAKDSDIDRFRIALRSYARAMQDDFNLSEIEEALRADGLPIYLIAKQQNVAPNMVIVDLVGNPDREFVLTIQLSAKPRRRMLAAGWPESPDQNLERLASAGFVQDRGIPICSNCGELGHIKKHCKQEPVENERKTPVVQCVYCHGEGHRARDCPKEHIDPYTCKNCKKPGHNARDCPEPRSAEDVECRKCNEKGHFSRDCLKVEQRAPKTRRNYRSEDHIAKDYDQPRNPDNTICHNCEKVGHFSRNCTEPKDWSKVQCTNCREMGHSFKRCKQPVAENGGDCSFNGGAVEVGDKGTKGDNAADTSAVDGWNNPDTTVSGGWNNGNSTASGNDWNTEPAISGDRW